MKTLLAPLGQVVCWRRPQFEHHGMPVCSTNWMPLKAASSLTLRLRGPPLAEGEKAGIRGCNCRQSSLPTGRRDMNRQAYLLSMPLLASRLSHSKQDCWRLPKDRRFTHSASYGLCLWDARTSQLAQTLEFQLFGAVSH